jgi:hypothetical protein
MVATTVPVTAAVQPADLSVAISSAASAKVDQPFTLTVTVRNAGPGATEAPALWLTPAFAVVTAATTTQGPCTLGATPGCQLDSIPAGGSITVTVRMTPRAPDSAR